MTYLFPVSMKIEVPAQLDWRTESNQVKPDQNTDVFRIQIGLCCYGNKRCKINPGTLELTCLMRYELKKYGKCLYSREDGTLYPVSADTGGRIRVAGCTSSLSTVCTTSQLPFLSLWCSELDLSQHRIAVAFAPQRKLNPIKNAFSPWISWGYGWL